MTSEDAAAGAALPARIAIGGCTGPRSFERNSAGTYAPALGLIATDVSTSLASTLLVILQDVAPPPEADIEKAIRQGTQYLLNRVKGGLPGDIAVNGGMGYDYNALMLYTLVHSGIGLQNDIVQRLLAAVLAMPFLRTYQVALTAAALASCGDAPSRARVLRTTHRQTQ